MPVLGWQQSMAQSGVLTPLRQRRRAWRTSTPPAAIFDNILSRNITWPEEMSSECRDFIECLLTMDPAQRLGRQGAGEVKLHPWFVDLNWGTLSRNKAAFIPALDSETDVSYFQSRKPVSYASMVMDVRLPRSGETSAASTPKTRRITEATRQGSFSSMASSRPGLERESLHQEASHRHTSHLNLPDAEGRMGSDAQADLEDKPDDAASWGVPHSAQAGNTANVSPEASQESAASSSSREGESQGTSSSDHGSAGVEFSNFSFKNLEALGARNREAAAEMAALRGQASAPSTGMPGSPPRWAPPWPWPAPRLSE